MRESRDVNILFPNMERTRRIRRGFAPHKYVLSPSYEELVKSAYDVLLLDSQENKRSLIIYSLVRKPDYYGYIKLIDSKDFPIATMCNSYLDLQDLYNGVCNSAVWHTSLRALISNHVTKPRARISNEKFMNKIYEMFPDELFEKEDQNPLKEDQNSLNDPSTM